MTRVIIDTDAGVDDALAIIYASRSPKLEVELITTVSGNVHVAEVTQNVLLLKRLLSLDAGVFSGAALPRSGKPVNAPEVHGEDGLGGYRRRHNMAVEGWQTMNAAEKIVEAARRQGRKLRLVSIGPMTNIAQAVELDVDAMRNIDRIIQMGGVFYGYGNTSTFTEFNIFADPGAADTVLKSGVKVQFIPLDVTEKIFMPRNILSTLLNSSKEMSGELKKLVGQSTSYYIGYHRQEEKLDGCFLHDPVAVAAAVNPSWFRFVDAYVSIETSGTLTSGMTLADLRKKPRRINSQIALEVDAIGFLQDFTKKVFGKKLPLRELRKGCLRERFLPGFDNAVH